MSHPFALSETDYYDPLPQADSNDYDATQAALLAALTTQAGVIDLEQIRLIPDPESVYGQHIAALAEPSQTDGSVSLWVMLSDNYGLSLPVPITVTVIQHFIDQLAERKASQRLGLLDEFDVDALLTAEDVRTLRQTCTEFLGPQGGTLLSKLGSDIISNVEQAQMAKAPMAVIDRIVRSEPAQVLARGIFADLGWTHDRASPTLTDRLLWKAISLDLQGEQEPQPGVMAGYVFDRIENGGRSCSAIFADARTHLMTIGRAASLGEATLGVSILALNGHPEWLVDDIPAELPYGTTSVWVNFKHGVTLAEAMNFGSSRWMSFKGLSELPARLNDKISSEEQQIAFVATRIQAVLQWARTNGHLRAKGDQPYTQQEIELAITHLELDEDQSILITNTLNSAAPDRRSMASDGIFQARRTPEIARALAQQGYTFPPFPLHPSIVLVPKSYPDLYHASDDPDDVLRHSFEPNPYTRKGFSLLEIYMSGENIDDWRLPGTRFDEGLREVNTECRLLYNALPHMPALFEERFQSWLQETRDAYATLIRKLLIRMPYEDRLAMENGEVTLYSLRLATQDVMASHENEHHREPLRGRQGFIMRAAYADQTLFYEVFPHQMLIRHRADLDPLQVGGTLTTQFWQMSNPLVPYPTSVYSGTTLPFDPDAYLLGNEPRPGFTGELIAETIGRTFDCRSEPGQPLPLKADSSRCAAIASTIATELFFVNPDKLHAQCKGITQIEIKNATPGEAARVGASLKAAFWDPVKDLLSGERPRIQAGSLSVSLYLLPYGKPVGKLLAGSASLVIKASGTVLARNVGPRMLSFATGLFAGFGGGVTSRLNRALLGKVAKGIGQFVLQHMSWRFVASRVGIGISRRLAAEARTLDE